MLESDEAVRARFDALVAADPCFSTTAALLLANFRLVSKRRVLLGRGELAWAVHLHGLMCLGGHPLDSVRFDGYRLHPYQIVFHAFAHQHLLRQRR
jgi:hypothetical protein